MQSVSGLAGPLGLRLNTRIVTDEKDEHKITEAAQRKLSDYEVQLIEKYRAGRGDDDEWAKRDDTIDTIIATENLKSEAKAIIDAYRAERVPYGEALEDLSWEQVMNMLYDRIRDSLSINPNTGESFWPALSVPEARNTRRNPRRVNREGYSGYRGRQFSDRLVEQ